MKKLIEQLQELDLVEVVGEFRKYTHDCAPNTYAAARLYLSEEGCKIVHTCDPSWCCSEDEYFNKSGVLSTQTILSDNSNTGFRPSPDDKFEWDYPLEEGETGKYAFPDDDYDDWECADKVEELKENGDTRKWTFFNVSDEPVDGWVPDGESDYQVEELRKDIDTLIGEIEEQMKEKAKA